MSGNLRAILILGFFLIVLFLGGIYLTARDVMVVK